MSRSIAAETDRTTVNQEVGGVRALLGIQSTNTTPPFASHDGKLPRVQVKEDGLPTVLSVKVLQAQNASCLIGGTMSIVGVRQLGVDLIGQAPHHHHED